MPNPIIYRITPKYSKITRTNTTALFPLFTIYNIIMLLFTTYRQVKYLLNHFKNEKLQKIVKYTSLEF